jgi:hypothetical protein
MTAGTDAADFGSAGMGLFTEASSSRGFPALDGLPWRSRSDEALAEARELLGADDLPDELISWLAGRPSEEMAQIIDRSLERTTHFKWFLGARPAEYVVWLHEYKTPDVFAQATSFAASVHNHRYGFCSRVLRGALQVSAFAPPVRPDDPVRLVARRRVDVGQTMILSHEDVHRVDRVAPHTCTLLVQGPAAREFSTCYDVGGGLGRRVYDMRSRFPDTLAVLAGGRADGAVP